VKTAKSDIGFVAFVRRHQLDFGGVRQQRAGDDPRAIAERVHAQKLVRTTMRRVDEAPHSDSVSNMRGECAILAGERHIFCAAGTPRRGVRALMAMLCNGKCLKMVEFAGSSVIFMALALDLRLGASVGA
jgi:hypothetical protein